MDDHGTTAGDRGLGSDERGRAGQPAAITVQLSSADPQAIDALAALLENVLGRSRLMRSAGLTYTRGVAIVAAADGTWQQVGEVQATKPPNPRPNRLPRKPEEVERILRGLGVPPGVHLINDRTCPICQFRALNAHSLSIHMYRRHGLTRKEYERQVALDVEREALEQLRQNQGQQLGVELVNACICPFCRFTALDRQALSRHMYEQHGLTRKEYERQVELDRQRAAKQHKQRERP